MLVGCTVPRSIQTAQTMIVKFLPIVSIATNPQATATIQRDSATLASVPQAEAIPPLVTQVPDILPIEGFCVGLVLKR